MHFLSLVLYETTQYFRTSGYKQVTPESTYTYKKEMAMGDMAFEKLTLHVLVQTLWHTRLTRILFFHDLCQTTKTIFFFTMKNVNNKHCSQHISHKHAHVS